MDGDRDPSTDTTRDEILDAALACFNEKGFTATTVEDVRGRSGASVGSIYHHFGGKEQIAAAIYVEGLIGLPERPARPAAGRAPRRRAGASAGWCATICAGWPQNRELAAFLINRRETEVVAASEAAAARAQPRDVRRDRSLVRAVTPRRGSFANCRSTSCTRSSSGRRRSTRATGSAGSSKTSMKQAERTLADAAWGALARREPHEMPSPTPSSSPTRAPTIASW